MAEFDSVIPAGGSGKVTAKVKTSPTQKGTLTKSVAVSTDCPSAASLRLIVSFKVEPVLEVLPKNNMFLSSTVGEAETAAVLLHRTDGKPLKVKDVEAVASEDLVRFEVEPFEIGSRKVKGVEGSEGDVWVVATLVPQSSALTRALRVVLTTNHAEMEKLELRVSVKIRSLIEPAPKLVRLLASDNPRHRRRATLRLTHTRGETFSVLSLKSANPDLFSVDLLSEGKLKMHSVGVIIAEDLDLEALESTTNTSLEIETDDPDLPKLIVPVRIDSIAATKPRVGAAGAKEGAVRPESTIRRRPVQSAPGSFQRVPQPAEAPTPTPAQASEDPQ